MLQTTVYKCTAPALPGQVMTADDSHYLAVPLFADEALPVGGFAFRKAADPTKAVKAGTGAVAGLVVRNQVYRGAGFAASNAVAKGDPVALLTRGNVAVVNGTATTVTIGMNVFAKEADGSVGFASATTLTNYVPTGFVVLDLLDGAGANGSLVLIGNYTA